MTDSFAQAIVILTYRIVWFIGQATIFWLLWNTVLVQTFGFIKLGLVKSIALYALLRLVVNPPKLNIEIADR